MDARLEDSPSVKSGSSRKEGAGESKGGTSKVEDVLDVNARIGAGRSFGGKKTRGTLRFDTRISPRNIGNLDKNLAEPKNCDPEGIPIWGYSKIEIELSDRESSRIWRWLESGVWPRIPLVDSEEIHTVISIELR